STVPSVEFSTTTVGDPPKPGTATMSSTPSPFTSATVVCTPPLKLGSNANTLKRTEPSAFVTVTRGSDPDDEPAVVNAGVVGGGGGPAVVVRSSTGPRNARLLTVSAMPVAVNENDPWPAAPSASVAVTVMVLEPVNPVVGVSSMTALAVSVITEALVIVSGC